MLPEGGHLFFMTGKIGILFAHKEYTVNLPNFFRIISFGFHITQKFNEFHLEIILTVLQYQIKGLRKQIQFNFILSDICKSVCNLILRFLYSGFVISAIQIKKRASIIKLPFLFNLLKRYTRSKSLVLIKLSG